jgi:hypothetical protein
MDGQMPLNRARAVRSRPRRGSDREHFASSYDCRSRLCCVRTLVRAERGVRKDRPRSAQTGTCCRREASQRRCGSYRDAEIVTPPLRGGDDRLRRGSRRACRRWFSHRAHPGARPRSGCLLGPYVLRAHPAGPMVPVHPRRVPHRRGAREGLALAGLSLDEPAVTRACIRGAAPPTRPCRSRSP